MRHMSKLHPRGEQRPGDEGEESVLGQRVSLELFFS